MYKIYIDWGYGLAGKKYNCFKIGEKLLKKLILNGIPSYIMENGDKTIELQQRIKRIREVKANILISIDTNWSDNPNQKGIETYYNYVSKGSELLAKKVQRELIKNTRLYSRGIISCNCQTNTSIKRLLSTNDIAIVTLVGFYSNPQERNIMDKSIFIEQVSAGIFEGLKEFLKVKGIIM